MLARARSTTSRVPDPGSRLVRARQLACTATFGLSLFAGHTLAGTAAQVLPAPYGVGAEVAALCTACQRGASRCSGRRWPALLGAWVVVAARTVHGVVDGHLLRAPA